MIRILTLALALAAAPASADDPDITIFGATAYGVPGLEEITALTGPECGVAGRTRIDVTFTDPDGISYAAVTLRSVQVRPAVSDRAETWLWIPDYARPARGYRWRYEEPAATRTRHTIPVVIELVPGAGPIPAEIVAKDGDDALTVRTLALVPAACR